MMGNDGIYLLSFLTPLDHIHSSCGFSIFVVTNFFPPSLTRKLLQQVINLFMEEKKCKIFSLMQLSCNPFPVFFSQVSSLCSDIFSVLFNVAFEKTLALLCLWPMLNSALCVEFQNFVCHFLWLLCMEASNSDNYFYYSLEMVQDIVGCKGCFQQVPLGYLNCIRGEVLKQYSQTFSYVIPQ